MMPIIDKILNISIVIAGLLVVGSVLRILDGKDFTSEQIMRGGLIVCVILIIFLVRRYIKKKSIK